MAKYKVTVNQGSRFPLYGGEAGGMELGQAQAKLLELWNWSLNTLTLLEKWHPKNNHHTAAVLRCGGRWF